MMKQKLSVIPITDIGFTFLPQSTCRILIITGSKIPIDYEIYKKKMKNFVTINMFKVAFHYIQ